MNLTNRVSIVTGSAKGLGHAMARALAIAGSDVVGVDLLPNQTETREAVVGCDRRFLALHENVAAPRAPDTIVAATLEYFGRVDVLVNNAGVLHHRPMLDVTYEEWDAVIATNLTAAFRFSQSAARPMVQARCGSIINIASLLAFQGGTKVPAYTASKTGLAGLTRAIANELGPHGVRVNAIAPGYMNTDNTAQLRTSPKNELLVPMIPLQRWGTPADLEGPVVFLASDASAYVTGHVLVVDGGFLSGNF